MSNDSLHALADRELLDEVKRAAAHERRSMAALIALLAELDERRLFLGEGCPSLFVYCTRVLRLSEHATYGRIAAARTSRRFPAVLDLLGSGAVTLTTVVLLAPHLTADNHEALLEGARHKPKTEVERMMACLHPQPDIDSRIRKQPMASRPASQATARPEAVTPALARLSDADPPPCPEPAHTELVESVERSPSTVAAPRATVAPLAPGRYLIKVTVSREAHDRLRRAQDLLRHVIPTGDPAAIIERALAMLVDQLEKGRFAQIREPRAAKGRGMTPRQPATRSRHVPASVRRAVWNRDQGRCAFIGTEGRCTETGFLEFHHLDPYADGGPTTVENLSLRCRAHNAHEAARHLGERYADHLEPVVQIDAGSATRSTPS